MKTTFLALVFIFFNYALQAQECPKYAELIAEADGFADKEQFGEALNKYQTAQTYCKSKLQEVQNKIKGMFFKINKLKVKAQEAREVTFAAQRSLLEKHNQLLLSQKELQSKSQLLFLYSDTLVQLKERLNYVQDSLQKQRVNELQVYQKFADSVIKENKNLPLITSYIDRLINSENKRTNLQQQIQKEQQKNDISGVLKNEYQTLYDKCTPNKEKVVQIENVINKIVASKSRYDAVSKATGGVPWYVIGILHAVEDSSRFTRHLHNGDPLTARTVNVPKGRPLYGNPPFTWEESAIDALTFEGFTKNSDWSITGILYAFEKFNGMGYRRKGINSPYLWSSSNNYSKGKYTFDGTFSSSYVAQFIGAGVLLKVMDEKGLFTK